MNTNLDAVRNHVAHALDLIERVECTPEPADDLAAMQSQMMHSALATALLAAGAAAMQLMLEKMRWRGR